MQIITYAIFILYFVLAVGSSFTVDLYQGLVPNKPTFFFLGDFQTNWGVWNYLTITWLLGTESINTNIYRNCSLYNTENVNVNNVKLRGHPFNSALNSWYVFLDQDGYFRTYQSDNLTLRYTSTQGIDDVAFIFSNYQVIFVIKSANKISKLNCLNNSIVTNVTIVNKSPTQV